MLGPSDGSAAPDEALPPRLFHADLTEEKHKIPFNGKEYNARLQITAYGVPFIKVSDLVSLATGHEGAGPCGDHFRKVVKNNAQLENCEKQLQNHIQARI